MNDPGANETDKIIAKMEERLRVEYRQAARETSQKVADHWRRYVIKDRRWKQWIAQGKKTEEEYRQWLQGQIMAGKRWAELRDNLSKDLVNVDKIAKSIVKGYMPEVYAINHAFGTYEIETGARVDTMYTIYSREALEFLFRENPQILPEPGKKVSKAIAEGRAERWNRQHIQSVMAQAILQGNSIPDIATRLANAVCETNRKAATRNARTMATCTQNAARIDAYKRAEDLGIKSKKEWVATLDMRTRHAHRGLDGQKAELDAPFIAYLDGGREVKIKFPGDPSCGEPSMIYNCRCTLVADVKGWESDLDEDNKYRSMKRLKEEGLTYEQWKKSRVEKPNPQLLPEEKQDAIRAQYIRKYRGYGGPVKSGRDMTLNIDSKKT